MVMNYFEKLEEANKRLTALAVKLLAELNVPERSTYDVCEESWNLGLKIFKDSGEDWDAVSETVALIADGYLPYTENVIDENGSLAYILGLSMAAVDYNANLLNLELKGVLKDPFYIPYVAEIKVTERGECIDVTMKD